MGWEIIVFHFFDSKTCESAANNLKVRIRQIMRDLREQKNGFFTILAIHCVIV